MAELRQRPTGKKEPKEEDEVINKKDEADDDEEEEEEDYDDDEEYDEDEDGEQDHAHTNGEGAAPKQKTYPWEKPGMYVCHVCMSCYVCTYVCM